MGKREFEELKELYLEFYNQVRAYSIARENIGFAEYALLDGLLNSLEHFLDFLEGKE